MAIKRLRKRADLTQEQAAEKLGVVVQSWRRYEWGERDLKLDQLDAIAEALGATREDLLAEQVRVLNGQAALRVVEAPPGAGKTGSFMSMLRQSSQSASLPIRDRIQAGAWLAADDTVQDGRTFNMGRDPRYPHADQWLSEVVGDSVNLLGIHDGDLVHLVDAIGLRYSPQTDDLVEVERLRFGGSERELSIKQVEVTPTGILLWPRSNNLRWQEPLSLSEGLGDNEEFEVRIRAKVIASVRRF